MSEPSDDLLPLDAERRVDAACARFEAEWRAGRRPELAAFLRTGVERDALLRELILLDVEYRRRSGETPQASEYREHAPRGDADRLADLLRFDTTATGGGDSPTQFAPRPAGGGRYELLEEIARGGMGAVYRAADAAFGRVVAVKVLLDGLGAGAARRFADEARITGQLQHPAIPPVHDLGTLPDGRPFLAMKLVRGRTLAARLKECDDPARDRGRFVAAFEQVCQAVAYAHDHNVIHRDLKPANVMIGDYGEVQVMDWGLAKVLGSRDAEQADPDETASPAAVQATREADSAFTQDGSVLGTPAYMPPEQALGAVREIGPRSDVFGLGAILAVILTGRPPFAATSSETTRLMAARGNVEECFARLDASGAEPELVALCKRCLGKRPEDRPADAGEVARAVAELRAAADERARQAELDRVKAEGDRAAAEAKAAEERNTRREAEARAEAERAGAEEQRKRRRVELALAGFAVLVTVAGGLVAVAVQRDRAEKRQEADRLIGERQRALTDALTTAETAAVPRMVHDLKEFRDLAAVRLRELAAQPVGTKPGLHARLALLADEPRWAAELAAYLPACKPDELPTITDALKEHAGAAAAGLWAVLLDPKADDGRRVRAACALAGLAPAEPRWAAVAPAVTKLVVRENPLAAAVWFEALEPVRGALVPALVKQYLEARDQLRGGKLDEVRLAAEISGYELTAAALARYTADRPAEAAELVTLVDPRHAARFVPAVRANKQAVVPVLKAELAKAGRADWTDEQHEALGRRRGQAAAMLIALGEPESAWPVFAFPKDGDPTARSHLLARLADFGADPVALIRRFEVEADVSARRALLLAVGNYPPEAIPAAEREALAERLLTSYREHPDPGLHGAIDWLMRQRWGRAKDLAAIDAGLAGEARGRVVAPACAALTVPVGGVRSFVGPQWPVPRIATEKNWFVNSEGQTFAIVRGPVEFDMGSQETEPGRVEVGEPMHRRRIERTFAIGTKEVTNAQFRQFRPNRKGVAKAYSPGLDTPAVEVTWYVAAEYCNWLSEREGIPEREWCYEPVKGKGYAEGMQMKKGHLKLTGYRLPTEAEWEFACRAGTVTARYYGRGEDLLPRYGWFAHNAGFRAWPAGQLRPNDLGLFDALGNALEWVEDPSLIYPKGQPEDNWAIAQFLTVDPRLARILRGGSFYVSPVAIRSAYRASTVPGTRYNTNGFRIARTVQDDSRK
jgi:formylglycine-generating enzyme required for sulfatase activity